MELLAKMVWPESGRYVLAVSGGVDSVALLDMMASRADYELAVTYVDHGWRDTSAERELVSELVKRHQLDIYIEKLNLNTHDENTARRARYRALHKIQVKTGALAVATAHHLDDRIETLVMNLQRGSGRRGLSPLQSTAELIRPLLRIRRAEIEAYARLRKLAWVEDPTNRDVKYRRNSVRHQVLPALRAADPNFDRWAMATLERADKLNDRIDAELGTLLKAMELVPGRFSASLTALVQLPVDVLQELLLSVVYRLAPDAELDSRTIEQLAIDLKTGRLRARRKLSRRLSAGCSRDTVTIAFEAQ